MEQNGFKRKLTAIFSADAVEYSRLMAEDETATVETITAYREVMMSLINQHRGRVVDSPGDNVLAEFSSVVDAVQCAVAVQNEFQARNAGMAEDRRMAFRIGINLGDVIDEEDRIYGDGVNVAARLESLADPGGICISKTAFDQIETKLPLGYEYLGEQSVKNIPRPVGAYRVMMKPRVSVAGKSEEPAKETSGRRTATLAAVMIAAVAVIGVVVWNLYLPPSPEPESKSDIDTFWKKEWLPLPQKPSIVVLPFINLSNDPEQDYFSDGLTEDIITDLAKISGLFVISRTSSFHYKDKKIDVQQVGRKLGVRYLMEGSVRKTGEQVRINAQLVDTQNGNHLWSERYDLEQKDLFNIQNQILENIVTAVDVVLVEGEQAKIYRNDTKNPEAYFAFAKALSLHRQFRKEANSLARQYLSKAIILDPKFANAIGLMGSTHWADARFGWSDNRSQSIEKGKQLANMALSIDSKSYGGLAALSMLSLLEKKYDRAVELREQAQSSRPNSASANALLALTYSLVGREEEALPLMETAMRLSPFYPYWFLANLCDIFRLLGRYEEAMAVADTIIDLNYPFQIESGRLYKAAILIELGRDEEARKLAEEYKKLRPTFTLSWYKTTRIYKDPQTTEKLISQLRKAGFPD